MKCPKCKNALLQKSDQGTRVRTKGPIVFDNDGSCTAQCYWCGDPVTIPLELRKTHEKFVIKDHRKA
jgi:hypothetical protein